MSGGGGSSGDGGGTSKILEKSFKCSFMSPLRLINIKSFSPKSDSLCSIDSEELS